MNVFHSTEIIQHLFENKEQSTFLRTTDVFHYDAPTRTSKRKAIGSQVRKM